MGHGKGHCILGGAEHLLHGPVLGILPDGGGPDEGRRFNGHADVLGDRDNGFDVRHDRPSGAVRVDGKLGIDNFPG
jgi:hypothetical protein